MVQYTFTQRTRRGENSRGLAHRLGDRPRQSDILKRYFIGLYGLHLDSVGRIYGRCMRVGSVLLSNTVSCTSSDPFSTEAGAQRVSLGALVAADYIVDRLSFGIGTLKTPSSDAMRLGTIASHLRN